MQIGIDLGASKIEYVLLDDVGNEHHRERTEVPKNYQDTLSIIKKIVIELERKAGKELPVGVCHPGIHSIQTGLVKNAPNSFWINGKPLQRDLRSEIGKEIYCENDANCFALSEAIDGSGKHYKIVFGVILGSGCGGGLVINKKILVGPNSFAGEWGHVPIGKSKKEHNIEEFISGKGLERKYFTKFKNKLVAKDIFKKSRENSPNEKKIVDEFINNLGLSLSLIINIIDPDAIVFGGGVSNEIKSLEEIKNITEKYLSEFNNIKKVNLKTVFLKPKYGDASGVRGAAILNRQNLI